MALPVNGSTHLIPAYYSFSRPRKDERLSWPSWLTCSGWLTHISGHPSAAGQAQDRESSPARDRRSTFYVQDKSEKFAGNARRAPAGRRRYSTPPRGLQLLETDRSQHCRPPRYTMSRHHRRRILVDCNLRDRTRALCCGATAPPQATSRAITDHCCCCCCRCCRARFTARCNHLF